MSAQTTSASTRALRVLAVLAALIILAGILSLVAGVGLYQYVYQDRIHMGVRAAGLDLGGLTREQAAEMLRGHVDYFDNARIRFIYGDRAWEASPAELGGSLSADAMAEQAYAIGRGGNLPIDLLTQWQVARQGASIDLHSDFNPAPAQGFVSSIASELDRPPHNASIAIRDGKVETTAAQDGWEVDQAMVVRQIGDRVQNFTADPIALSVVTAPPLITDVSAAKAATEKIISGPVTVTFQDKKWTLSAPELANLVVFYRENDANGTPRIMPRLNQAPLKPWVEALAGDIKRDPQEGQVRWDTSAQRVVAVKQSAVGYDYDPAETLKKLNEAVMGGNRTIPAVISEIKPTLDTSNLDALGIKELVVKGTTQFKGSPPERIQNIAVASQQFQDVLVPPGGVFSFGDHLGDVTPEKGYAEALIIVGTRTETDYGGGICQVSTTAFRAAFFGGYPIVERTAHAYRVSYYEEGVGPGLDATVFTPYVDFKFKNDQPTWLLIRTELDKKNSILSFYFYGTKPNREVKLEGPKILSETPSKPPTYQADPKLQPGEVKQVDWAHPGATVVAARLITEDGQTRREEFRSVYQPWGDIYLVSASDPRVSRGN
ncbi:MAG: VanW family protein [Anaerolineae bacterium]